MVSLTCLSASDAACSRALSCRLVRVVPSRSSLIVGAIMSYACRGSSACGGIDASAAAEGLCSPGSPIPGSPGKKLERNAPGAYLNNFQDKVIETTGIFSAVEQTRQRPDKGDQRNGQPEGKNMTYHQPTVLL